MKYPRAGFSGFVIGHKIYVIGGYTGDQQKQYLPISDTEVFDFETKEWKEIKLKKAMKVET